MATEAQVDALLREFDAWFQKRPNEPLVRSELAILKTFCWYLERVQGIQGVQLKEESDAKTGG